MKLVVAALSAVLVTASCAPAPAFARMAIEDECHDLVYGDD
jgi:hypothetical protein